MDINRLSDSDRARGAIAFRLVVTALILSPSLFALLTFPPPDKPSVMFGLAIPVTVAELAIVFLAMAAGYSATAAWPRLAFTTRLGAAVWLVSGLVVATVVAEQPVLALCLFLISVLHAMLALGLSDRLNSIWQGRGDCLLMAAAVGAALYCVTAYGLLLSVRHDPDYDWITIGAGVSNVRQLAFYGLTAACGGLAFAIHLPDTRARATTSAIFAAVAIIGIAMVFWCGSRAGTIGLLLSIVLLVLVTSSGRRLRSMAIASGAVAGGALLSMIWVPPHPQWGIMRIFGRMADIDQGLEHYSSSRWTIWQDTLSHILDKPLFGHGMGMFKADIGDLAGGIAQPHNFVLQFLYQWGIVGTGAVLLMIWPAIRRMVPSIASRRTEAIAALSLIVGQVGMAMMDGNLFYTYPTSIVVLALVVLAADRAPQQSEANSAVIANHTQSA
ncbi:MAG: O-antigen ligase family protein [Tsuneonella suprasediminis]|uniref:O-antigen ligase domain-containing protein n=1 Tax=Tsuneonella suprasediminis TaxID=2306996 RepID=A0A419QZR8_9SPHN|nr:O-antigen ligase family protein [Tsuneonella suprasediminis]RJX66729.1 O-antigen ligase domain-containing protein [Tsuneonella suprasediminis]UBS32488.1 O-antigen ligase family protein [Altererythrobacter sp. N1]